MSARKVTTKRVANLFERVLENGAWQIGTGF